MAQQATTTVVILFEDEIRLAAKALAKLDQLKDGTPEQDKDAVRDALEACWMALYNAAIAESDDVPLALATRRLFKVGPTK